jgi:hypothetical protein
MSVFAAYDAKKACAGLIEFAPDVDRLEFCRRAGTRVERNDVFHSDRALEVLLRGSRESSVTGEATGDEVGSARAASDAMEVRDLDLSAMD